MFVGWYSPRQLPLKGSFGAKDGFVGEFEKVAGQRLDAHSPLHSTFTFNWHVFQCNFSLSQRFGPMIIKAARLNYVDLLVCSLDLASFIHSPPTA